MATDKKINVALVGLGFGGAFAKIYRDHPNVNVIGLYDVNNEILDRSMDYTGIKVKYDSFDAILADKSIDAVHLVTPIPLHEEQTVKVLESGKHCACTVPMATTLEGLKKISDAVRTSGKNYMMMETALYTSHFLYAKEMLENGEFGRIQFLRGAHYQDMEFWPDYWLGLPPMLYGTHAIAPLIVMAESSAKSVVCFGSGTMREELCKQYGNPYPIECSLITFENGLVAEATRSLFETARSYTESFNIYGSLNTFEWAQIDHEPPLKMALHHPKDYNMRGLPVSIEHIVLPNKYETLPESIQRYTVGSNDYDETNPQDTLKKGASGGHGGSHPHLVNEFVMSIIENRKPSVDEVLGANITAAGICSHMSAMQNGARIEIPRF